MDKRTLRAIEASIRHWIRMRDGKRREMKDPFGTRLETPCTSHCALCRIYDGVWEECTDCPIKQRTGLRLCQGTPYMRAAEAVNDLGVNGTVTPASVYHMRVNREIDFLRSLLPKHHPNYTEYEL